MTTIQTSPTSALEKFLARYEAREQSAALSNGLAWIAPLRQAAAARFAELGFPTPRQEAWKHTNVAPFMARDYHSAVAGEVDESTLPAGWRERAAILPGSHTLVFVNGFFAPSLSQDLASEGIAAGNWANSPESAQDAAAQHFGQWLPYQEDAFRSLNLAMTEDGAVIHVPKGDRVERPIHLVFLTSESTEPVASYPRNLIVLEEGAEAAVVESFIGPDDSHYFTCAATEILVRDNAALDHYRIQEEGDQAFHYGALYVHEGRDVRFSTHIISIGAKTARNDLTTVLAGEGIDSTMNGLFITRGDQHVDNHTTVEHAQPHCNSHELFKGVLDDRSSGAFTGRIIVRPQAQKTDAIQSSKNLLLSDQATINPDPQLEIYADDVRCTHGATIGQLDEDAVFYLRSRGIPSDKARGILTYAFANEVIDEIRIESIRDRLESLVAERFRKETESEG